MDWVRLKVVRIGAYEPSESDLRIAYERVFAERDAFAETLARVCFDDIARGEWGGSYYMDGRVVPDYDSSLYGVGGAMEGIVLSKSELRSEDDVKAAVELLREQIVIYQSDSDDPICFGFWIDGDTDLCYFDVSNVVSGFKEASQLANLRGELAIYHYATHQEVRAEAYAMGSKEVSECMRGWATFMKRRHDAYNKN